MQREKDIDAFSKAFAQWYFHAKNRDYGENRPSVYLVAASIIATLGRPREVAHW